jgi:glycosyltransferase involved in cell wall biosynthesis
MDGAESKGSIIAITDRVGDGATNGAQIFANALLLQLAQWFDITIVAGNCHNPAACLARRIVLVPQRDDGTVEISSAVLSQLQAESPALVYNLGATSLCCRVAEWFQNRAPKVPLVNHFQVLLDVYAEQEGWDRQRASELAASQRTLAEVAERNLFVSFSELSTAVSRWHISSQRNFVVPNAFVGADVGEHPSTVGMPFTFFAAGRFADYVKGADLLYRAFAELHNSHPFARLEIASGDDRFLKILKPLPANSWTLLGWLDRTEVLRRMRLADVVVVPSRYEPFGLVAVEAMAMGTPVIAMAVGGLAEIICHGVTGWLCPPEEGSLGLRLMMNAAMRNHPRALAMAQDAQQLIAREYSLGVVAQRVRLHLENAARRDGRTTFNQHLHG